MKFDHKKFSQQAIDNGLIIEIGYLAMLASMFKPAALEDGARFTIDEMRIAYFNGAQHLFASIMQALEPGNKETDNDLSRMNKINDELEAFRKEMTLRFTKPQGRS